MNKKIMLTISTIIFLVLIILLINFRNIENKQTISNFEECVEAGNLVMESYPRQCRAGDKNFVENITRQYVGHSPEECSKLQVLCVSDRKYFSDETGCGCELKEIGNQKINCTLESRNADFCIEIYQPVCGFVEVECITAPCDPIPQTFSNNCFACLGEKVLYYTEGECE